MKLQNYRNNGYDTIILRDNDDRIIRTWYGSESVDEYHRAIAYTEDLTDWNADADYNPNNWQPETDIDRLMSEYVSAESKPDNSMTQYIIADAVEQTKGLAPNYKFWSDTYSNNIKFYALDDETAIKITEAIQKIHDTMMLYLHTNIKQNEIWKNAPCYTDFIIKYIDGYKIKVN